jgi:hypothetical protein
MMANVIVFGLNAEGSTDYLFLKPLIERTIEEILLECDAEIELFDLIEFPKISGESYSDTITRISEQAQNAGVQCLVLHVDSDDSSIVTVMQNKIVPAQNQDYNVRLLPLIPVHMTEAWMLADTALLKQELGIHHSVRDDALNIDGNPERFADPKEKIREIIRYADSQRSKRRRKLNITKLYLPLGQQISINALKRLSSFQHFYQGLRETCFDFCKH